MSVGLTVYFIGAGLTKSLELMGRVPLMTDFVPVLADYLEDNVVLDTLVQMEIGRVYETACDACFALADKIASRDVPTADNVTRDQFAKLVRNRPPESIEALFKRLASMPPNTTGKAYADGLPVLFRYAINRVFSTIGWGLKLDLLSHFLTRQFGDVDRTHVFVSFNYDLVLDRAIELASNREWQAQGGYGFEFKYFTVDGSAAYLTEPLPTASPKIRILKPHGSLNWLRLTALQTGSESDPHSILVPLDSNLDLRYWVSSNPLDMISFPDRLPSYVEMLIIPPSPVKPPIPAEIRDAEIDALTKADEVFVIGYSMPTTDDDQWNLINVATRARSVAIPRLTIINYHARAEFFKEVGSLFRAHSICSFNDGFAEFSARE